MTSETNRPDISIEFVYEHLLCEFHHYDFCLSGLIEVDGDRLAVKVREIDTDVLTYEVWDVDWTQHRENYLTDYQEAFGHWFYKDGKRLHKYNGEPTGWFRDRWNGTNPIMERDGTHQEFAEAQPQ